VVRADARSRAVAGLTAGRIAPGAREGPSRRGPSTEPALAQQAGLADGRARNRRSRRILKGQPALDQRYYPIGIPRGKAAHARRIPEPADGPPSARGRKAAEK